MGIAKTKMTRQFNKKCASVICSSGAQRRGSGLAVSVITIQTLNLSVLQLLSSVNGDSDTIVGLNELEQIKC